MPTSKSAAPALPPITHTAQGKMRRVGVEIEFSGLSLQETAAVLCDLFGGPLEQPGRYEIAVNGDPAGPWQVELDFTYLKQLGRLEHDDDLGGMVQEMAEEVLRAIAERVVPVEVVGPPLPMDRLSAVNQVIAALRAAGARGTGDGPVSAFGMQLNPELPDTDVDTVRGYLQAYLCLEDWLRMRSQVDLTRRLTFFADPFPKSYARVVIDAGYSPNRDRLIDDYLAANPTRNRSLDLLPLFAHLDASRVRRRVDDERIKARPTLHYRLPNSEIDRPDWNLNQAWEHWLVLERLATDPKRLALLCRAYAAFLDSPIERLTTDWAERTQQWLDANPAR
jgi:hypothetical protein